MIDDSHKFSLLKHLVEEKFGQRPRTPDDFRALSAAIREEGGQTLGVTTLKRLWGYIANNSRPTFSTRSILSRYAGYSDWDVFTRACSRPDDASGFNTARLIMCVDLRPGQIIILKWGSNKGCKLRATDNPRQLRVIEAVNIKLLVDDLLTVESFIIGQPLMASECLRGTTQLGSYTSGRRFPLSEINLI